MGSLIAVAFRDPYRAAEVLNEVRRREWDWAVDLDRAIVVRWDDKGKIKVQFSVDPTNGEGAAWARLWGSLLGLALFLPVTNELSDVVKEITIPSGIPASGLPVAKGGSEGSLPSGTAKPISVPNAGWWKESLRISREFIRDIGALIQPGDSALFMLLLATKPLAPLKQLRNYGGTALYTELSAEQTNQLKIVLAFREMRLNSG